MSRLMLDTNALIDLAIVRDPAVHAAMEAIIGHCVEGEDELLVPVLALKDASYAVENGASFKQVLPHPAQRRALAERIRALAFSFCRVCAVDEAIARKAHRNSTEDDFDDALVAECALAYDADLIISSDRSAFTASIVPKRSPQEHAARL